MRRKFSYKITLMDLFLLFLGFGLAVYDMTQLKTGIHYMTGENLQTSQIVGIVIATIANTFAFMWGQTNGKKGMKKAINKVSFFPFSMWFLFGIGYAIIESISAINLINDGKFVLTNQIGGYLLLLLSYVSSGLAIHISARDIWNVDSASCRASEMEYKAIDRRIEKEDAAIKSMLTELDNYNQKYDELDEQYEKQLKAIEHAETSVINEILGKTMQQNPKITPSKAREVVERAKKDFLLNKA